MSVVTPGQRHGNTTPGVIQFDLFENLGFTFLDKALRAAQIIKKPTNLHSQNYILKLIRLNYSQFTTQYCPSSNSHNSWVYCGALLGVLLQ